MRICCIHESKNKQRAFTSIQCRICKILSLLLYFLSIKPVVKLACSDHLTVISFIFGRSIPNLSWWKYRTSGCLVMGDFFSRSRYTENNDHARAISCNIRFLARLLTISGLTCCLWIVWVSASWVIALFLHKSEHRLTFIYKVYGGLSWWFHGNINTNTHRR